jgi:transcriptional regulator GlxA family with amidase domain
MSPLRSRNASAARYELYFNSNGASAAASNGANGKKSKFQTNGSAGDIPSLQESRIRKILKLIESDPGHSIQDLAALCNLSHSHLQHLFKKQTGVQLGHLLLQQRLLKSAQLLENSNMSVKEIAFAVGYEHTSSFTRAFERRFSVTPRSYREQVSRNRC